MANHDGSYKYLFSQPRMVEDLLTGFVKEEWVKELDFTTLEKMNGSYVTDDLRERADDIIWRVRWGQEWLYVYILLEFQATVDHWMAVRIMTYIGLLYQDVITSKKLKPGTLLPPVLPVVLYNGDRRWNAPTEVGRLIREIPGGLSRYRPSLPYLLISEREYTDDNLKDLHNLVAALFRLENSRHPQQLLDVVVNLLQWLSGQEQDSLRRAFTVWFARVLFPSHFDKGEQPAIEKLDEVKNMLAERVKEWNRESLEKGLRKGMRKGRQEGTLQVLQRQLERRFGPLSPEILRKLTQADEEQLLQWSERILFAENLEDVFQD